MGCACEPRIDPSVRETADELTRQVGLDTVSQLVQSMIISSSAAHRSLRRVDKGQALGINIGEIDLQAAERDFTLARRQAEAARAALRAAHSGATFQDARDRTAELSPATLEQSTEEAKEYLRLMLLGSELPADDSLEVLQIWERAAERVRSDGIGGIYQWIDENLTDFGSVLTEAEDWGRRPNSPLQRWQWILIALIIGIAVAALLWCLFCCGCSWVKAIFIGFCIAARANGTPVPGLCLEFAF
jgi:hypothetical protein